MLWRATSLPIAVLGLLGAFGCGTTQPTGTTVLRGMPAPLQELRVEAGLVYERLVAGDDEVAFTGPARVEELWREARGRAERDGAPASAVGVVASAVTALRWSATGRDDPLAMARAANEVTGATATLVAFYRSGLPPDTLHLDYLQRELALDGLAGDLASAAAHARELEAAWLAVRAHVLAAGGRQQTDAFDASVGAVKDAIVARDLGRLVRIANRGVMLATSIHGVL
ncbi:MAG: hypothetical protein JXB32_01225 [Deltaproteobacteria bacterium]|nr:hypothetical protein [Deltaproteobacteria bacterium]